MTYFQTRNEFILSLQKGLKICEVGVFTGRFSEFIYNNIHPSELHLIDIFEGMNHSGVDDGEWTEFANLSEVYHELMEKYENTSITLHKGFSKNILKKFEDNYFDLIYIDADHTYETVRKDLDISLKKTKVGGIISGHDYIKENFSGVYRAVNEFCIENKLKIDFMTLEKHPSYGIIKK